MLPSREGDPRREEALRKDQCSVSFVLPDVAATRALGEALAKLAHHDDIIAISGDLGAGKTTLVQGYCDALGVSDAVSSPTFNLVHLYDGFLAGEPIELWHCDLYRLEHAREALALGLEEAFGRAIVLIEWPERLGGDVPEEALVLTLQQAPQAPQARIAHMQAGTIWQERLDLVKKIYEQGVDPFKL